MHTNFFLAGNSRLINEDNEPEMKIRGSMTQQKYHESSRSKQIQQACQPIFEFWESEYMGGVSIKGIGCTVSLPVPLYLPFVTFILLEPLRI